jgi:chlorobactene glucosyltransferase
MIVLSFVQDLRQVQAHAGDDVTATGLFILVRRDAYGAVGGHAAVCSAICEDLEFARRVKQSGRSVLPMGGERLMSTRMYTGWRTLWPGLAKNLVDTLGGPAATLSVALAGATLVWAALIIPLIDLVGCLQSIEGAPSALAEALTGSTAAFGLHIASTFYFRIPFWYGLLFPLGYTVSAPACAAGLGAA